jgi:Short C-terminal domain
VEQLVFAPIHLPGKGFVMKTVKFSNAQYLGGLPHTNPTVASTILFVGDEGIGFGKFSPKNGVAWGDVSGVSFDSEEANRSAAGKALAVGIALLNPPSHQSEAYVTFTLKDGNAALYRVVGKSVPEVREKVQPFLVAAGVSCLDDRGPQAAPVPASAADEIVKLAQLRDTGVLTEDEFIAHKAKLLE